MPGKYDSAEYEKTMDNLMYEHVHKSFPAQGNPQPAHLGSQSSPPGDTTPDPGWSVGRDDR